MGLWGMIVEWIISWDHGGQVVQVEHKGMIAQLEVEHTGGQWTGGIALVMPAC